MDYRETRQFSEHTLFLGLGPIALGALGVWALRKRNPFLYQAAGAVLAVSVVFSLGPMMVTNQNVNTGMKLPYYWLYSTVELFRSLRVPSRFLFLAYVPVSIFVAYGYHYLSSLTGKRRLLFLGVLLFLAVELGQVMPIFSNHPNFDTAMGLKKQGKLGFLENSRTVHLPTYVFSQKMGSYLGWIRVTGEKSFNGYAGYFPLDWIEIGEALNGSFDGNQLNRLRAVGYDYLIVHADLLDQRQLATIKKTLAEAKIAEVLNEDKLMVFGLNKKGSRATGCAPGLKPGFRVSMDAGRDHATVTIGNPHRCYLVNRDQRYYHLTVYLKNILKQTESYGYIAVPMVMDPATESLVEVKLKPVPDGISADLPYDMDYKIRPVYPDEII